MPNPVFGKLLENIDELSELRCTLRLIYLTNQKKGTEYWTSHHDMIADPVLVKSWSHSGKNAQIEISRGLQLALQRGTIIAKSDNTTNQLLYSINVESARRMLNKAVGKSVKGEPPTIPGDSVPETPNIFELYENNIGMLNPIISDDLRDAEQKYPANWIEDAFREAVRNNRRNWSYVAAILERWEREGKSDGKSGRRPKKTGYQEYFRR